MQNDYFLGVVTIDDLLIRIDQAIHQATVTVELSRTGLNSSQDNPSSHFNDLSTETKNTSDHKCINEDGEQEESIQLLLDEIHTVHDIFTTIRTKPGHYKVLVDQGSTVDSCIGGDTERSSTDLILPMSTVNNSEDQSIELLPNQFVINELSIADALKESMPIEGDDVWINIDCEYTPLLVSAKTTENNHETADPHVTTPTQNPEQSSEPITITKSELQTES